MNLSSPNLMPSSRPRWTSRSSSTASSQDGRRDLGERLAQASVGLKICGVAHLPVLFSQDLDLTLSQLASA